MSELPLGDLRPARGFYERLGAAPMDEWAVYCLTGDALRRLASK